MGCDIHFYVERREHSDAPWTSADKWIDDDGVWTVENPFYDERNYDLFGMLANVRNGNGFAGISTGKGFIPMHEPRGWPNDTSPEINRIRQWIEHTPTWCTLREIMDYDWARNTTKSGVVNLQEWARWICYGQPNSWHTFISELDVFKFPANMVLNHANLISENKWSFWFNRNDEIGKLARSLGEKESNIYIPIEWKVKYSDAAKLFLHDTVPRLWKLGAPENVRCLFYFDS